MQQQWRDSEELRWVMMFSVFHFFKKWISNELFYFFVLLQMKDLKWENISDVFPESGSANGISVQRFDDIFRNNQVAMFS